MWEHLIINSYCTDALRHFDSKKAHYSNYSRIDKHTLYSEIYPYRPPPSQESDAAKVHFSLYFPVLTLSAKSLKIHLEIGVGGSLTVTVA